MLSKDCYKCFYQAYMVLQLSVYIHFNVSFQSEIEWLLSTVGMYHKGCNYYKKTRELANWFLAAVSNLSSDVPALVKWPDFT